MLNFLASFAFYGSLFMYAIAGLVLFLCTKWIVQAWLLNRRTQQWMKRILNEPMSSNVAPWGRKAGR